MVGSATPAARADKWNLKLKPRKRLWLRETVYVSYRPEGIQRGKRPARSTLIHPTFNNDRLSHTPAFTLPSVPIENEEELREMH